MLNIKFLVKEGAMLSAIPSSILTEIPSGPLHVALLKLSYVMRNKTLRVQRSSVGTTDCMSEDVGEDGTV